MIKAKVLAEALNRMVTSEVGKEDTSKELDKDEQDYLDSLKEKI